MHCEKAEMLLPLLVFDEIDDGEKIELLAHLAQCASCCEKLGDLRVTYNLLREGVAAQPVPAFSAQRRAKLMKKLAKQPKGSKRGKKTRPPSRLWPIRLFPSWTLRSRFLAAAAGLALALGLTAIMLPATGSARRTARQMQNSTHARGIHSGLILESQRTGKYANSIGELVEGNYVSPEYLISPSDTRGVSIPKDYNNWSKEQRVAWANENSSYAFVRPGEEAATNDSRRVVLFEKPSPGQKGISVVYDDNHAVRMPIEEAAKEIQASTGKSLNEWNESFAFREKLRKAETTNTPLAPPVVSASKAPADPAQSLAWGRNANEPRELDEVRDTVTRHMAKTLREDVLEDDASRSDFYSYQEENRSLNRAKDGGQLNAGITTNRYYAAVGQTPVPAEAAATAMPTPAPAPTSPAAGNSYLKQRELGELTKSEGLERRMKEPSSGDARGGRASGGYESEKSASKAKSAAPAKDGRTESLALGWEDGSRPAAPRTALGVEPSDSTAPTGGLLSTLDAKPAGGPAGGKPGRPGIQAGGSGGGTVAGAGSELRFGGALKNERGDEADKSKDAPTSNLPATDSNPQKPGAFAPPATPKHVTTADPRTSVDLFSTLGEEGKNRPADPAGEPDKRNLDDSRRGAVALPLITNGRQPAGITSTPKLLSDHDGEETPREPKLPEVLQKKIEQQPRNDTKQLEGRDAADSKTIVPFGREGGKSPADKEVKLRLSDETEMLRDMIDEPAREEPPLNKMQKKAQEKVQDLQHNPSPRVLGRSVAGESLPEASYLDDMEEAQKSDGKGEKDAKLATKSRQSKLDSAWYRDHPAGGDKGDGVTSLYDALGDVPPVSGPAAARQSEAEAGIRITKSLEEPKPESKPESKTAERDFFGDVHWSFGSTGKAGDLSHPEDWLIVKGKADGTNASKAPDSPPPAEADEPAKHAFELRNYGIEELIPPASEDESGPLQLAQRNNEARELTATLTGQLQELAKGPMKDRIRVGNSDGVLVVEATPEDHKAVEQLIRQQRDANGIAKPKGILPQRAPADDNTELQPAASFRVFPVNPWTLAQQDAQSTFALDVDTASYTLGRRYIQRGYLPPAGSVRMEEYVNAFDYNDSNSTDQVFRIHAEAAPAPFATTGEVNTKLVKIGVKGKVIGRDGRKPANLVLVVDTSGSMARPDRLPLIQHSLELLVSQLSEHDTVSLVTFGSQVLTLLDGTPASNKDAILTAIRSLQANGPTNLLKGLEAGYKVAQQSHRSGSINRVIVCSDGIATLGETEADTILGYVENYRKQGISCTSVGFGAGAYDDDMMEKLANKGDGAYYFVDSKREARKVFVDELTATLQTIAKDAKIQVEFNPQRVRRYRLIGYENRAIADKDFRNDTIDAGEVGSGQAATALYEVELIGDEKADIGTIFVRYRNADTEKIEEISQRLGCDLIRDRTPKDDPRFYLAACAAEFAELLRQSEHAAGGNFTQVQSILEQVVPQLPLDEKAAELLDLVRKAQGLPRAP